MSTLSPAAPTSFDLSISQRRDALLRWFGARRYRPAVVLVAVIGALVLGVAGSALAIVGQAVLTVTPLTWDIIGLDSNNELVGPQDFPVGARVCNTGTAAATNVSSALVWDSSNPYIDLAPGNASSYSGSMAVPSLAVGACTDFYYTVRVQRTDLARETARRYHITAAADGGLTGSTPTPRELYVEYLISQNRNQVDDVQLNGVSYPPLGTASVFVGGVYTVSIIGHTATQGYNQFEMYFGIPNTVFQIVAVSTTYSSETSNYVSNPNDKLYADACLWDNDPNSPTFRSCIGGDAKAGGDVRTDYTIKILGGGGNTYDVYTMMYDFSGSSFHYNSDLVPSLRYIQVVSPTASVGIAKSFSPSTIEVGGTSVLRLVLTSTMASAVSAVSFTDTLPAGMTFASPVSATTANCGSPSLTAVAGTTALTFTNGTVPPSGASCVVQANVTVNAAATYTNTTGNVFIGGVDTGSKASATLRAIVPSTPAPVPSCENPVLMVTWDMTETLGTSTPPTFTSKSTQVSSALASFTGRAGSTNAVVTNDGNPKNSWRGDGFSVDDLVYTVETKPYFEFTIDTSKFGDVRIVMDAQPDASWGASNNLRVYARANSGAFTDTLPASTSLTKNQWTSSPNFFAAATGSVTTTFRVNGDGATNTNGSLFLDNIQVWGCGPADPPTLSKQFSPDVVGVGQTTNITFTIANPNGGTALSGVTFTDALPSGLLFTGDYGGADCSADATVAAGSPLFTLNSASLAAGQSCAITATVTASASGSYLNVTGQISSTETGTNSTSTGYGTAKLKVVAPPSIVKWFSPDQIRNSPLDGSTQFTSTLNFAIVNPNLDTALSGVQFVDNLPSVSGEMRVAAGPQTSTSGCGGSPSVATSTQAITLTNAAIVAGGTCYVSVDVYVASTAATAELYTNTTGNVQHTINGKTVDGNQGTSSLTGNPALPAIALKKWVGVSAAGPWLTYLGFNGSGTPTPSGTVYYSFTVENVGNVPLTNISLTDDLISPAPSCSWPSVLPVATQLNENHVAFCVAGPVTASIGAFTNTATVTGAYTPTSAVVTSTASSAVAASQEITLTKTGSAQVLPAAGSLITYTYVVTNSGSAILPGPVRVVDDKIANTSCAALVTIGDLDLFFDPGESLVCTGLYTVTSGDVISGYVTNIAYATTPSSTVPATSTTVSKQIGAPLAVSLVSFDISSRSANSVTLAWETGSETNNYGFRLYRAASSDSKLAAPVAFIGSTSPGLGAQYSHTDSIPAGSGPWWYWLVNVSTQDAAETWHFPPVTTAASEQASRRLYLPMLSRFRAPNTIPAPTAPQAP